MRGKQKTSHFKTDTDTETDRPTETDPQVLWDFPNSHLTGSGTEEREGRREGGRIMGGMQKRWAK